MKLFLISQTQNEGYDTYSDAVVAAENKDIARNMYPRNGSIIDWDKSIYQKWQHDWCDDVEEVAVKYLGEATEGIEQGIICASYHAG